MTLRERRKLMQMIFQDPFASLDPAHDDRRGHRRAASDQQARDARARRATDRRRPAAPGRPPARHGEPLPARVLRRPAPAHLHRAGARGRGRRLIVADEAVSALDVSVKAQVVNLMLELQAGSEARLSLHLARHGGGRARQPPRRGDVSRRDRRDRPARARSLGNPQHPYTRRLLAAVPVPDPARRGTRHRVPTTRSRAPIRPADYVPPERLYREVSPGHAVQIWGEEWDDPMLAKDLQGALLG